MPHAIYLHSGLTQNRIVPRNDAERRKLISFSNREVVLALGLAGLVNMAMLAMAAAVFHDGAHDDIASIETAYFTLIPLMGIGAAAVFLTSLIASGLSSSAVGTMAGQVIMQGFVGFHIPLWVRRVVTMIPSIVVVALGVDATRALVLSQVVLSLVLPVPMISLLILTRRPDVMGASANGRYTSFAAIAAAGAVLALNGLLILDTLGVHSGLVRCRGRQAAPGARRAMAFVRREETGVSRCQWARAPSGFFDHLGYPLPCTEKPHAVFDAAGGAARGHSGRLHVHRLRLAGERSSARRRTGRRQLRPRGR